MTNERRFAPNPCEVRSDADGVWVEGYASTFSQPYDMGWYTETVSPGAFSRSLGRSPDVRLLANHDGLPLARTTSGTLHLSQDDHGLKVRALLEPSDPDAARLIPKMQRGDLNQMSFGFRMEKDGQEWNGDMTQRTLRHLDIHNGDVSLVTYPANPNTTAAVRSDGPSMEAVAGALIELERRGASAETLQSVLARVLGYFTSVDNIVDSAQAEIANVLGIPNPDEVQESLADSATSESDDAARAALIATEHRIASIRALVGR